MPALVVPRTMGILPWAFHPDWCHASWAASRSSLDARSIRPSRFRDSRVSGMAEGRRTSAAVFTRCRETSNTVTSENALLPVRKPVELADQPRPSDVTMPAPVTTTLRLFFGEGLGNTFGSIGACGSNGVAVVRASLATVPCPFPVRRPAFLGLEPEGIAGTFPA